MTEAIAGENSTQNDTPATPADIASQIDASLKTLLILVGRSMQAKKHFAANVQALQMKAASTKEEIIMLQQSRRGQHDIIPGLKLLEAECIRYDAFVKQLSSWIISAKESLLRELEGARAREELERIENERRLQEAEVERLKEEEKRAAEETRRLAADGGKDSNDPIVVEDDEDDDMPLAKRDDLQEILKNTGANEAVKAETTKGPQEANASMNAAMTDPTALVAALTANAGGGQSNETGTSSMALDNFDFSQLGLQNMDTSATAFGSMDQGNNFTADPLDFSMDFLDYNTMDNPDASMAGGMVDTSALFSNIDFGALLGNNGEAKKE